MKFVLFTGPHTPTLTPPCNVYNPDLQTKLNKVYLIYKLLVKSFSEGTKKEKRNNSQMIVMKTNRPCRSPQWLKCLSTIATQYNYLIYKVRQKIKSLYGILGLKRF